MGKDGKQSYYEILDVSFNANPEIIRTAYIRAKNAYNRDSLASYSLFDKEESRRILDEIEEAYTILSDSEKRKRYDESHGIISSEEVYNSYHKGNHAVAAFTRERYEDQSGDHFQFENDPFRKPSIRAVEPSSSTPSETSAPQAMPSHIERLQALQNKESPSPARSYLITRTHETNPEMEEKIQKCENINGAFLRSVREYKKVSTDEIIDILKISRNYLTALEEDDLKKLPANVFVRGFVIQYAKALKLDHEKVATSYMEFLRSNRP